MAFDATVKLAESAALLRRASQSSPECTEPFSTVNPRRLLKFFAIAFVLLAFRLPTHAAPGDLDPTFGDGGKVTTAISSSHDYGSSVALQGDGKIVVAGSSWNGSNYDFSLARYNVDGTLDSEFGSGGKVITAIGRNDGGFSVTLQADGMIVVAGYSQKMAGDYDDDFAVARYNADGLLDTSFGSGGKVTTDISSGADRADQAHGVAVQGDGKIVLVGESWNGSNYDFALARYGADGVLDSSFGSGGIVITAINITDIAHSVAVQSDGKIVVVGSSGGGLTLVRYTGTGALDPSFGDDGGKVVTPIGSGGGVGYGVAVQADGKIVVAGSSSNGSNDDFALARYNANGTLDSSFGSGGKMVTAIGNSTDRGYSVAIQSDGKIVVAGYSLLSSNYDFAVVRYDANGALDSTFASGGKATTFIGGGRDEGYSVALQNDGKIVVAGTSYDGSNYDFALVRYFGVDAVATGTVSFHSVTIGGFANATAGFDIDARLVPQANRSTMLNQPAVSEGLVADGVTPLLVKWQLSEPPSGAADYRIRVVSVSGNHATSEIEQRLRLLRNGAWVPFGNGSGYDDTITIFPTDDPPVGFAHVEAFDASFIQLGETEVAVELGLQKADGTGAETTKTFKICRPPVALVHGYNTTGEWGAEFVGPTANLVTERPADFVKVIRYGVNGTDKTENTYGSLSRCAELLSEQLASHMESATSPLRSKWAFTRYDAVGHSQGGVLLRMLSSANAVQTQNGTIPAFRNASNSSRGRFRRVITIGSPHNGSRLVPYLKLLARGDNPYAIVPSLLQPGDPLGTLIGTAGTLQPKFDPWGEQIRDLNAPGGRWTPDGAAKFLLLRTTINDGKPPSAATTLKVYQLVGLDSGDGPTVVPNGSDGVVELDSQGRSGSPNVRAMPTTSNIAHAGPLNLFGADSDDVNSSQVANAVREELAGPGASFGGFPVPPLLSTAEKHAVTAAALRAIHVGDAITVFDLVERESVSPNEPRSAPAPPPSATYGFMLNPPAEYPIYGPVVWSVDVFGPVGVTPDGVNLAVDLQDSRKVTVTVEEGVVGDVVLSAHYALVNGGVAFATAVRVVSNAPPSATLTRIELEPGTATLPAGTSVALHLWANYSDGSRLLVFPEVGTVTFNSLTAATAEVSPSGIVGLKAEGNATIEAAYGGQTAQAQFVVIPMENVPVVPSDDARLSALSIAEGTLSPAFDSAVTSYATTVGYDVKSATISATVAAAAATIQQMPANPVSLSLGENLVQVKVTAEDGTTTTTYTVTITREHLAAPRSTQKFATSDTAPGRLASVDLPDDAVIASFGTPAIDDDGNIAFVAKWASDGPPRSKGTGLFLNDTCLAVAGGDASAIATGVTWKSFSDPVVAGGKLACIAKLSTGVSAVVFTAAGTTLGKVALTGEIGTDDGATFKSFKSVTVVGSSVAFLSTLAPGTGTAPRTTAANDTGIWLTGSIIVGASTHALALREGDASGGKTIKKLVAFAPGNGSAGCGRGTVIVPTDGGDPQIGALAKFTDGTQGVIYQDVDEADFTLLSLSGATGAGSPFIEGVANATFASYGPPARSADENDVFRATLTIDRESGITKANASGIFAGPTPGGLYAPVALAGENAGMTGVKFKLLKDPVLAADGGLAFPAMLSVRGPAAQTLWWRPPGVALRLLAQGGGDADEVPGAKWKSFGSLAIAGGGRGPIFSATLSTHVSGVWAIDFTGTTRLLFKAGDQIDGKPVKSFTLLKASVGSTGVTRSFNDAAQVVWLATFNDESQAIVTTEVP